MQSVARVTSFFFLFLLYRTPLERSCVHNAPPIITNSCLPPAARAMFCWPRSASTARIQVWIGFLTVASNLEAVPDHRSDSKVVLLLWWAAGSMSKKPQTSLSDQVGERTASGGCSDFHVRHMAYIYMVSSESFVVPTCQMHQCESTRALLWTMFCTHTSRQGLCMSGRGVFWYPAWCLTSRFFFPASSCRIELCQSDTRPHLCCHQRSRSCYPDRQRRRPFQHVHLPPGLLSKAWMGNLKYFGFRPV